MVPDTRVGRHLYVSSDYHLLSAIQTWLYLLSLSPSVVTYQMRSAISSVFKAHKNYLLNTYTNEFIEHILYARPCSKH